MKKLGILIIIFAIALISCGEESISQRDKRLAKKRLEKGLTETPVIVELSSEVTNADIAPVQESIEKIVHVTYTYEPTDSSYWFVILQDEVTKWHGTVELATPYFDFYEARKQFKSAKGNCFFEYIVQINKESITTFYKHAHENEK